MTAPKELVAVVMAAGKGSRMTELTARRAKCLLPVGNMPMLFYPLILLERSGFQEAIVIVQESAKNEVSSTLERTGLKIKLEYVCVPGGEDWGTADSLRQLQCTNKIDTDVLVISSDLITDVNLSSFIDMYRMHDASITALFVPNDQQVTGVTPGPKAKAKLERDLVGICENTSRLVFLASASDYEEELPLSCHLIQKYGRVTVHSKLLDAHVYIISKWLCQYLTYNKNLSTLKGEVLPYVVKKHLAKGRLPPAKIDDKGSIIASEVRTDISQYAIETDLVAKIRKMSCYSDNKCQEVYDGNSIRCYAYICHDSTFTIRANTLQQYHLANKQIIQHWRAITNSRELVQTAPTASIESTQFDAQSCLVGDSTKISDKTSISASFISSSCAVSPKTQIRNCIIMSGVKIGQGCNLNNCIICEESVIGDFCELKDCLVGSHHMVPAKSKHSNEVLTDVERLMEI